MLKLLLQLVTFSLFKRKKDLVKPVAKEFSQKIFLTAEALYAAHKLVAQLLLIALSLVGS